VSAPSDRAMGDEKTKEEREQEVMRILGKERRRESNAVLSGEFG